MRKSRFYSFDSLSFLSLLTVNVEIIFPPVHMQSVNNGSDIYINSMCSNRNISMFLLPNFDTLKFENVCRIFSSKEHDSFWLAILQHIHKSYVKNIHNEITLFPNRILCVQIRICPCSYCQFATLWNSKMCVSFFPVRNMLASDLRFCNISRNPMCSNRNMSLFLFPILYNPK